MLNVEQLKYSINHMAPERVCEAVLELRLDGIVTDERTRLARCTSTPASLKSKRCSNGRVFIVRSMSSVTRA